MSDPIEPTAVIHPIDDEAPATEATTIPARSVDDFLTDLDAVLDEATALTTPAPAPEPNPEPDAAATMPDVDLSLDMKEPPAAPAPPAAAPTRDWWDPLYRDDTADQDNIGDQDQDASRDDGAPRKPLWSRLPDWRKGETVDLDKTDEAEIKELAVEEGEEPAPDDDEAQPDDDSDEADDAAPKRVWDRLKKKASTTDDADHDDVDESDEAPAKPTQKWNGKGFTKKAGAAVAGTADGLINNPRGRQVIFASTAAGLGWGLHLNDVATNLMTHAAQYAIPVTGCALGAGVLGLVTGTKFGGVVFVSSLALITALTMVDPARIVGGGVALGCQIAYRVFRGWVGRYGDEWPWKGVVWFAHVPAATATVAFLLYGTN